MRNKIILGGLMFLTPVLALGQGDPSLSFLTELIESVGNVVAALIPILIGLALVVFFWGLIKFIFSAGDEEARSKGKHIMIWGLIALVVMVAVWGLVEIIAGLFGITDVGGDLDDVPGIQGLN